MKSLIPVSILTASALAVAPLFGCAHTTAAVHRSPFEQSRLDLAQGKPLDALPVLKALHQKKPTDLAVARALVEAYVRSGKNAELGSTLAAEKGRAPEAVRRYMLGLLHFSDPATAGKQSIDDFRAAAALKPREAELHYRLGLALLDSEKFTDALDALRRASQLAPKETGYDLPLAEALYRTGHSDEAVEALRKLVSGDPTEAQVKKARLLMVHIADPFAGVPQAAKSRLDRGLYWLDTMDVPQNAIISFEDLLNDFPDLGVVHALLGLAYEGIDDAGQAVTEFKRAIELSPKIGKNHLYVGQLYLSHQRPEKAKVAFEKAVALDPLLDEAHRQLGDLAFQDGDLATAKREYRILVALKPSSNTAKTKLAAVLQRAGDYSSAAATLEAELRAHPDDLRARLRLGLVYVAEHQHATDPVQRRNAAAKAESALEMVLDRQPGNAFASRALASLRQ